MIQEYKVTKKTRGSVTCPHCGGLALKHSYTVWKTQKNRKGYFPNNGTGKGVKFTDYQHVIEIIGGFAKMTKVGCTVKEDVACQHGEKITSSGRCYTCKKFVRPVEMTCTGNCGKTITALYEKRYYCDCNPAAPFKMILVADRQLANALLTFTGVTNHDNI